MVLENTMNLHFSSSRCYIILYYTKKVPNGNWRYVGGFRKRTRILPKIIETAFYLTYRELCINI